MTNAPHWNIRNFLLQSPKPAAIRCTSSDREPHHIKPGGRSWAKIAETIAALGHELLECLDAEGNVLRATRPEQDLQRSDAAEVPEGLKNDANALLLTHLANLIHRAYEHSTQIAFEKLVDVTDRMNARSESIERRLERAEANNRELAQQQIDDQRDRVDEMLERIAADAQERGGDPKEAMLGAMLQAFMSGSMQKGAAAGASNGHSNGKGTAS
jgi:hypothetical protein